MKTLHRIGEVRTLVAKWRRDGASIALVPTMGNLHAGHLMLVNAALARADRVVTSVFVNPLQFGAGEDLDGYPRTLKADAEALSAAGNHCLFAPADEEVYPEGRGGGTRLEVPGLSATLCGASRPGHFQGVATVVAKLFNMVLPDLAVFGEKDFQQLLVIRRLAADLNFPVEIIGVPTVRESDGLAMSSRNGYLTPEQRDRAPQLHRALRQAAQALAQGASPLQAEQQALATLMAAGFDPDYVSVRFGKDLSEPVADRPLPQAALHSGALVILAAARLGAARLIDNLVVSADIVDNRWG